MTRLFHRDFGKGPPILFLHGFCETHEVWSELARQLCTMHRILLVDLPGFGHSEALRRFTLHDLANLLIRWLKEHEQKQVLVVGHSLGGYIALEMVHLNPELFAGIVLFQSTSLPDTQEKKKARVETAQRIEKGGVQAFIDAFVPTLFADRSDPAIVEVQNCAHGVDKNVLVNYVRAMQHRPDRTNDLKTLGGRVLLVGGDSDSYVPVKMLERLQKEASGAEIAVLRGSAHMGMLENARESLDLLVNFARKCLFYDQ
jgi:pimeloyl-ACP methyl ester carboxylesterase